MSETTLIPPSTRRLPWGSMILRKAAGDPYASDASDVVKGKTARQAMKAADLDFTVIREAATAPAVKGEGAMPKVSIGNKWFARRSDNGAVVGFLGPDHELLQPREMAEFADLLVDTHESSLVGMGTTHDPEDPHNMFGQKAFVVVKLDEPIMPNGMPDEATEVFLFLSNAWDSSQSFTAAILAYREVCVNGLRYPLKDHVQTWRIRHDRFMHQKMALVAESIQSLAGWAETLRLDLEKLMEMPIVEDRVDHVVNHLLPRIPASVNDEGKVLNAAAISRRDNQREAYMDAWLSSDTLSDEVRLTGYGALNAFAEWDQYGRSDLRMDPIDRLIASPQDGVLTQVRDKIGRIKLN